jgi:hypothetical protein
MSRSSASKVIGGAEPLIPGKPTVVVQVIDAAAPYQHLTPQQRIDMFGRDARHDWRIQVIADHGSGHVSRVALHKGATADDVAQLCEEEGWSIPPEDFANLT